MSVLGGGRRWSWERALSPPTTLEDICHHLVETHRDGSSEVSLSQVVSQALPTATCGCHQQCSLILSDKINRICQVSILDKRKAISCPKSPRPSYHCGVVSLRTREVIMGKSVTQTLPAVSSLCDPEWALLSHWPCIPFSVTCGGCISWFVTQLKASENTSPQIAI